MNEDSKLEKRVQDTQAKTTKEAIMEEILGDVWLLKNEIRALKESFPTVSSQFSQVGIEVAKIVSTTTDAAMNQIVAEKQKLDALQFSNSFRLEAEKTLQKFQNYVTLAAPARWKYKLGLAIAAQGLVCAIAGASITYLAMLHNYETGARIEKASARLDPQTRARLIQALTQ